MPAHARAPRRSAVLLRDGRRLSFMTAGCPTSTTTVILHHGWPSSAAEVLAWHEPACQQGLAVIAVDRMGVGFSSFNPQGSFASYADDVSQLLRHLGVRQVIHIGTSGGGPYASACAALCPQQTTAALGLVASMTHCAGPGSCELVQGMDWLNRLGFSCIAHAPGLVQLGLAVAAPWVCAAAEAVAEVLAAATQHASCGSGGGSDSSLAGSACSMLWRAAAHVAGACMPLPAPDCKAVLWQPRLTVQTLSAGVADAFRQGSRGLFADMRLTTLGPWDFDLGSISAPTVVFQGPADVNVTLPMARWLSQQIPGAQLREVADEAHLSMVLNHAAEVLRTLQDRAASSAAAATGRHSPLRTGLVDAWQAVQCAWEA